MAQGQQLSPCKARGVDSDSSCGAGAFGLHPFVSRGQRAAALFQRSQARVLHDGLLHRDGHRALPHDEGEGSPSLRRGDQVRGPHRLRVRSRTEADVAERMPWNRVCVLPPRGRRERVGWSRQGRQVRAPRSPLHLQPAQGARHERQMGGLVPPGGASRRGDEGGDRPRRARLLLLHGDDGNRKSLRRQTACRGVRSSLRERHRPQVVHHGRRGRETRRSSPTGICRSTATARRAPRAP